MTVALAACGSAEGEDVAASSSESTEQVSSCRLAGKVFAQNACTQTKQCDGGRWVDRVSDPSSCKRGIEPDGACVTDNGSIEAASTCVSSQQCDDGVWVSLSADPAACRFEGRKNFHGVNWADERDNYVDGLLQPSGLSSASDSYSDVRTKADAILAGFESKLGANTIRIPINEPTVSSRWWNAYRALIDAAVARNMNVIIAYWAYHKGRPDSESAFRAMWRSVLDRYGDNPHVYFDIHNEPYGFGDAWPDEAASWLNDFPRIARSHVLVAGTGYDGDITPVGSDARLDGCLLELHIYAYWEKNWTNKQEWTNNMLSRVGRYSARVVVGEWGATMNDGIDYNDTSDGNNKRAYVAAVSEVMRKAGIPSVYWPGLRIHDGFSMTTLDTATKPWTLSVTNKSGLDRLHLAWGL